MIVGLDLSLTATGFACDSGPLDIFFETLSPGKRKDLDRLHWIKEQAVARCQGARLVMFEGLSFGSNDPSAQERAGLAYLIRYELWLQNIPFILVAPTSNKKFVTGKGNAEKSLIIREVFRRYNLAVDNDNEADACVLCVIGQCLMGLRAPETEPQREVLKLLHEKNAVMITGALKNLREMLNS